MVELIGKSTIHPLLFYPGKIAGYFFWIYSLYHTIFKKTHRAIFPDLISWVFFVSGSLFTIISLINLGSSVRLGIPARNTVFKTSGLYSFSRNPMYVGFNLLTFAGMTKLRKWPFILLGLFSVFVYHLIILGEERFLEKRFGEKYRVYKRKVKRYI